MGNERETFQWWSRPSMPREPSLFARQKSSVEKGKEKNPNVKRKKREAEATFAQHVCPVWSMFRHTRQRHPNLKAAFECEFQN
eukprot:460028-Amorphochlora_amoeboformis.AAC.1